MSSPPPGGPQTPQPPYPQQYPPQQPYYPQPAAPPPKKSNTLLIVVIIVVVVVVLAAVAWYAVTLLFRPVANPQITVTGVSWTVTYPGSTQYFGASPLTACNGCPITAAFPEYRFIYTLTLTNSDSVAHNVTGISVSGFTFNLVSASPDPSTSSPVVVNAGASRSFTLTIQATPLTGSYTMSGTITTT
jgi:hypothetical protein